MNRDTIRTLAGLDSMRSATLGELPRKTLADAAALIRLQETRLATADTLSQSLLNNREVAQERIRKLENSLKEVRRLVRAAPVRVNYLVDFIDGTLNEGGK